MKNLGIVITGFVKDENNHIFACTPKGDMFVSMGTTMSKEEFIALAHDERIAKLSLNFDGNKSYLKISERPSI